MSKLVLTSITSGYSTPVKINGNNDLIEAAVENTLSRDGTSPNQMESDLDMNSNRIINLGSPINANDAARYQDVVDASVLTGTVVPSQVGNANKALFTDGAVLSFRTVTPQVNTESTTTPALNSLNRTAAEIAASATPVNYSYAPGKQRRLGTNTTPGTTDTVLALQAAIDSASATYAEVYPDQESAISKPLLLRSTTQQNIGIIGNGRVSTILNPTAASIATAPVSVNALIINQNNNTHLHLRSLRFGPDVHAYTGVALYCKEGGGSDASTQALFSAVIDDCWFSLSSNNTGYCRGGLSNLQVNRSVFEGSKTGCFILEGAGNSDQLYVGNVMNACYDAFIYGAIDTVTKAMITVNGLHAYQHMRGPLIEIKNGKEMFFTNIILEPDAANVGSTGLFKFTDCVDVLASNFYATTANGEPKCATGIEIINAFTGKFVNGKIAATTGLKFSGTGALDVTFDNVDFSGCDNAVDWNSGTLSGKVTFRNCRFNDQQHNGLLVSAGTMSFDLTLINCEVLNAGLSGTATDRNFDLNTSGKVRLMRCKIGQDNGSAAATHYIRAQGSGTFDVIDPIPVGTPPTAFVTGSQTVKFDGVNSDMPGMLVFAPSLGGTATYTVQVGYWMIVRRVLYFWGQMTVNAIGSGSANTISGFPYLSNATTNLNGGGVIFELTGSNANVTAAPTLLIASNSQSATIKGFVAAAAADATVNIMTSGTNIRFKGSYPLPL